MELFVFKVALVVACAFALFALSRWLSRHVEHNQTTSSLLASSEPPFKRAPAVMPKVGRELPFPFDVRVLEVELEAKYGPDFFRPKILNYYFGHMDIETGPTDPADFYDEFYIEFENPTEDYRWTTSYWVTTPAGLARQMDEERTNAIWGYGTLTVRRYNLETILRVILEDYAESRAAQQDTDTEKSSTT
jgi:hypothetical protein